MPRPLSFCHMLAAEVEGLHQRKSVRPRRIAVARFKIRIRIARTPDAVSAAQGLGEFSGLCFCHGVLSGDCSANSLMPLNIAERLALDNHFLLNMTCLPVMR
jgi:hypothetical protein